jgi:Ser/Thr protein kinase RdoA (MazF antagonist)
MRTVFDQQRLLVLLTAWRLQPPVRLAPVVPGGTTSKVWRVETGNGVYAAKLVYDQQRFVEPGLQVAGAVATAGVCTGAPRPSEAGPLTVEVSAADGARLTLAVLEWCDGQPLAGDDSRSAEAAGDLLGRVHAALAAAHPQPEVPGELLRWFDGFLSATGDADARNALGRVQALVRDGALTMGIVYGDPSPEVLVTEGGGLALIDWGTPSFGPLLHDVLVWTSVFGSGVRRSAFLAGYHSHDVIGDHEYDEIDSLLPLVRSLTPR